MIEQAKSKGEAGEFPRYVGCLEWILQHITKDDPLSDVINFDSLGDVIQQLKPTQKGIDTNEKKKIIFYFTGGVSYTEIALCNKYDGQSWFDLYIGSTSLLTPSKYITQLIRSAQYHSN